MVWCWIFGILLCIVGLFMLVAPKAYYRETQAWKQNKPNEPSREYVVLTRVRGGVVLLGGIVSIVLLLIAQLL